MKTQTKISKQEKIKIEIKIAQPKQEIEHHFLIEKIVPNCEEF